MIPLLADQYRELAAIADREAGLHMPEAKHYFVASRLQRRLRANGLPTFAAYLSLLGDAGPDGRREVQALVSALTTNVTDVFREGHHFKLFADHLAAAFGLPGDRAEALVRSASPRPRGRYLVWSAGCSTGEEPLSMAAICHATLGVQWSRHVRILATDVDVAVLEVARDRATDTLLANRLRVLPVGVVDRGQTYPEDAVGWMRSLQAGITVLQHNLLHDLDLPGRFDTIFCRNVTIYFNREAQGQVHTILRSRLAPGGLLALGHSERLFVADAGLVPVGRTAFRCGVMEAGSAKGEAMPCH